MTDTKTLEGIKAKNYDLYLIEGNYDEDEIQERIKIKEDAGLYVNEYRTIQIIMSRCPIILHIASITISQPLITLGTSITFDESVIHPIYPSIREIFNKILN